MVPILTKKCIYVVKTGTIRKFHLKGIAATTIMPALCAVRPCHYVPYDTNHHVFMHFSC